MVKNFFKSDQSRHGVSHEHLESEECQRVVQIGSNLAQTLGTHGTLHAEFGLIWTTP